MIAPQPIPFSPDQTVQTIGREVTDIKNALGAPPVGTTVADQAAYIADRLETVRTAIGTPTWGPVADQLETVRGLSRAMSDAIGTPQGTVADALEVLRHLTDNLHKAIGTPAGQSIAARLEAVEELANNVHEAIGTPQRGTVVDKLDALLNRDYRRSSQEYLLTNLIKNCIARPADADNDTRLIREYLDKNYKLDIDAIRKEEVSKLRAGIQDSGLQVVTINKYRHFVQVLNEISG